MSKHLPTTLFHIGCLILPGLCQATEWSLNGSVDQFLGYDTNVLMTQQSSESLFYKIIPVLSAQRRTDITELKADASYGTQTYSDLPDLNQDIQNYGLSGLYKTERIDWKLGLNYSVIPTRNQAAVNSGVFSTNSDNTTKSITSSATYRFDERNSLILSPTYSESSYTKSQSTINNVNQNNFRDYNTFSIGFDWQHFWTERYSSSTSFFYSNFSSITSDGKNIDFNSYGINYNNSYLLSQKWKLSGTIGGRYTESILSSSNTAGSTSTSIGFLTDLSAVYTGDNLSSALSFSRSLAPSSLGQLQELTSAGWSVSYKFTERLMASFDANYIESNRLNGTNQSQSNRQYIDVQPALKWQIDPDWSLISTYRFRTQDRSNDSFGNITNKPAESNLVMFTINYNWKGMSISR